MSSKLSKYRLQDISAQRNGPKILLIEKNYRLLACEKKFNIKDSVYNFIAQMEVF